MEATLEGPFLLLLTGQATWSLCPALQAVVRERLRRGSQGGEMNLEREVEGANPGEAQATRGSASGSSRSSSAREACPAAMGEGQDTQSGELQAELLQAAVGASCGSRVSSSLDGPGAGPPQPQDGASLSDGRVRPH